MKNLLNKKLIVLTVTALFFFLVGSAWAANSGVANISITVNSSVGIRIIPDFVAFTITGADLMVKPPVAKVSSDLTVEYISNVQDWMISYTATDMSDGFALGPTGVLKHEADNSNGNHPGNRFVFVKQSVEINKTLFTGSKKTKSNPPANQGLISSNMRYYLEYTGQETAGAYSTTITYTISAVP